MNHSTGKPTKAQAARMDAIVEFGCIACYLDATRAGRLAVSVPCEVHHMLSGNKRIGHDATVGLCKPHHVGISTSPVIRTRQGRLNTWGPSWHKERRAFRERYGSDAELVTFQTEIMGVLC